MQLNHYQGHCPNFHSYSFNRPFVPFDCCIMCLLADMKTHTDISAHFTEKHYDSQNAICTLCNVSPLIKPDALFLHYFSFHCLLTENNWESESEQKQNPSFVMYELPFTCPFCLYKGNGSQSAIVHSEYCAERKLKSKNKMCNSCIAWENDVRLITKLCTNVCEICDFYNFFYAF